MLPSTRSLASIILIAAVPGIIVATACVSLAKGWELRSRLELLVLALAATSLLVTAASTAWPRSRRWLHAHASRIALSLLSALLALGVGEAVLQFFFRTTLAPAFHTRPAGWRLVFHPTVRTMPGVHGDSKYSINSRGIRGPELPLVRHGLRLLCLGGSTTECSYLDDTETWPHLLMHGLNQNPRTTPAWVGSAGLSGFGARQHLKFVRESSLLEEVDGLVILVGINDFMQCINPQRAAWKDQPDYLRPVWTRLLLLQGLRYARVRFVAARAEDFAGLNYEQRRRERREGIVVDELPDLTRALHEYEQQIEAIIELSRQRGVCLVFLTQPTLWDDRIPPDSRDLLWMGSIGKGKYLSIARLHEGMQQFNERLIATCREADVMCLDLDSMTGKVEYFYDACHFNESGARQVASIVLPPIIEYLPSQLHSMRRRQDSNQLDASSREKE